MKKLLSVLLVCVMLLSLLPAALASEEFGEAAEPAEEAAEAAPIEEPVPEEPAEEPAEEAADEPLEGPVEEPPAEPAPDGAGLSVSGTLDAHQFSDGADLVLKGDTTLIINADKTLRSISGNYRLTISIESGKTLTVKNTGGHAIAVSTVTVSGAGSLILNGTKDALHAEKDIDITGVRLDATAGESGVYSYEGSITMDCTASIRSTGGCAVFAPWGKVTLSGDMTAVTLDDDASCIQSGDVRGSRLHIGQIVFQNGSFTINAKGTAVYSQFGDLSVSGDLKATSSDGVAILSNKLTGVSPEVKGTITFDECKIEARGKTTGIYCAGNIVIMSGEIFALGDNYGIYAGDGFTMSSKLAILTPGTGQIQGNTIVYSGGQVARTVEIGLPRITGTAKLIYPDDRVYVGDTVSLELTGVPASPSIQWERSENGWDGFEDIPGAIGTTYTVRAEDRGWKIQARVTAAGYSGTVIGGGAFVYSRPTPITRVDFTSLTTTLTSGAPERPAAVLKSGSHCSVTYRGPWLERESGDYYTGAAVLGKVYYYNLEFTPDDGYTFGDVGAKVPVYLNGTKLGDAQVLDYGGSVKLRITISHTVTLPANCIAISEENFPDAWFRDYISEYIDKVKDGYLTVAERQAVTEIDIDNCENQSYYWRIDSLEGIQFFSELEYLYCGSGLKTLDLSGNAKLIEVRLNNDDAGGDLTSLNVKGCTQLESLSLYDNRVSALDLSTNTKLKYLNVDGNKLTSLDLSKNTLLESLYVGGNTGLASLDLSRNKALRSLAINQTGLSSIDLTPLAALDYLRCDHCGMTALNVTKNTALTRLDCSYNNLTALNVTKNAKLTTLDCRYNALTALDISGCPALSQLSCIANKIKALDLSGSAALASLTCYGNDIARLTIYEGTKLMAAYTGAYHSDRTETINGKTVEYTWHSASGGLLAVDRSVKISTDTLLGDVDHNGQIQPADAALILKNASASEKAVGDVSGDGKVTRLDAAMILQYCAGDLKKFPAA